MNAKLNGIKVWPGILGSHRSTGLFGVEMGLAFGRKYMKLTGDTCANTPSHNFIIVKHKGQLWIGDCVRPKAKLTSFKEYEAKIAAGEIRNVQLFEVNGVNRKRQAAAATWWMDNVLGQPYDSDAFFRLGLKVIFGDWFPKAAGKDWKWWCTEGKRTPIRTVRVLTYIKTKTLHRSRTLNDGEKGR